MEHYIEQAFARGIEIKVDEHAIARQYPDSAIIIRVNNEIRGDTSGSYRERKSNGDYEVLVCRNGQPKTTMFRRSNQPFTCDALRVRFTGMYVNGSVVEYTAS